MSHDSEGRQGADSAGPLWALVSSLGCFKFSGNLRSSFNHESNKFKFAFCIVLAVAATMAQVRQLGLQLGNNRGGAVIHLLSPV